MPMIRIQIWIWICLLDMHALNMRDIFHAPAQHTLSPDSHLIHTDSHPIHNAGHAQAACVSELHLLQHHILEICQRGQRADAQALHSLLAGGFYVCEGNGRRRQWVRIDP